MENKLFSILRVWKNAFPASILFYFICPLSRLEFDTFFFYDIFLPDRISQFLSQITCPELDLCDYTIRPLMWMK